LAETFAAAAMSIQVTEMTRKIRTPFYCFENLHVLIALRQFS
jgi:hypothetical protein